MKVFVAGASGAIGRRLIPMMVRAGHVVVGMTRSPGKADSIRAAGAEPVVADALDEDAVMDRRQARQTGGRGPSAHGHPTPGQPPDVRAGLRAH